MISKQRFIFIVIFMVFILLFSYVMNSIESSPKLDINNLVRDEIVAIKIEDRGILGNDSLEIIEKAKVAELINLITSSKKVGRDSIKFKASHGLCELKLRFKNKEEINLTLTKTTFSGGILVSGSYCYRNDLLLKVIEEKLSRDEKVEMKPIQ